MKCIVSLTPGAKWGWIVTLDCGHTRFLDTYPSKSRALCWVCPKESPDVTQNHG